MINLNRGNLQSPPRKQNRLIVRLLWCMSCHHGGDRSSKGRRKLVNNRVIIYLSKLIAEAKGVFDHNSQAGNVQPCASFKKGFLCCQIVVVIRCGWKMSHDVRWRLKMHLKCAKATRGNLDLTRSQVLNAQVQLFSVSVQIAQRVLPLLRLITWIFVAPPSQTSWTFCKNQLC